MCNQTLVKVLFRVFAALTNFFAVNDNVMSLL